jgi:hypothetical protein
MRISMSLTPESNKDLSKAQDEALGPCGVCGGVFSEHVGRIHAFTQVQGSLVTQQSLREKDERRRQQEALLRGPSNQILNRLIEVLEKKGLFENGDLMYITGLKGAHDGDGS